MPPFSAAALKLFQSPMNLPGATGASKVTSASGMASPAAVSDPSTARGCSMSSAITPVTSVPSPVVPRAHFMLTSP